jgi:hypothetical protein
MRDSARYVRRYCDQARNLSSALASQGDNLRVVVGEGDSKDNTRQLLYQILTEYQLPHEIPDASHGFPWYGSIVHPDRFKSKARADNATLSRVKPTDDIVVFIEADLLYEADVMVKCINHVKAGVDVLAPLIFAGKNFYDIWAFEKDGVGFGPFEPWHHALVPTGLTEIDSAGSCLVMKAEIPRRFKVPEEEEWRSFCKLIRKNGYHIYTTPELRINHPA